MVITFPRTVNHPFQVGQLDLEFDSSAAQLVSPSNAPHQLCSCPPVSLSVPPILEVSPYPRVLLDTPLSSKQPHCELGGEVEEH